MQFLRYYYSFCTGRRPTRAEKKCKTFVNIFTYYGNNKLDCKRWIQGIIIVIRADRVLWLYGKIESKTRAKP